MSLPRLLPLFSLLCATLLVWPVLHASAAEENEAPHPSIAVTGVGRVNAVPDIAEISVGVQTLRPTAQAALAANTELMTSLMATLEQAGLAKKDIQTSNINVSPQFSQPRPPRPGMPQVAENEPPQIIGYQVSNTVTLTVRDISNLGALLDSVVKAGANQIYGIQFRVDKPESLLDQAREQAVADARRKAEILARAAGVELGPVRTISESSNIGGPQPMFRGRAMAMAAPMEVPVSAGEQEMTVSASVVFDLKQP